MSDKTLAVTDASFQAEVIEASRIQPVLVDFWAPWCGPCRSLTPTVEAIARDFDGKAKVSKLNTDENQITPNEFGIRGIPTLILFKDGKEVGRIVGLVSKSEIEKMLQKHLA